MCDATNLYGFSPTNLITNISWNCSRHSTYAKILIIQTVGISSEFNRILINYSEHWFWWIIKKHISMNKDMMMIDWFASKDYSNYSKYRNWLYLKKLSNWTTYICIWSSHFKLTCRYSHHVHAILSAFLSSIEHFLRIRLCVRIHTSIKFNSKSSFFKSKIQKTFFVHAEWNTPLSLFRKTTQAS